MADRKLKLGLVLTGSGGPGNHNLWLDPEIPANASVDIDWYIEHAKKAEESKKLGGLKEKGKAKKMLKAMAEYAKLEKELRGELGDDEVNKLMQQAMDSIKNAGAPEAAAS